MLYAYAVSTTQFTVKAMTNDGANVGTGYSVSFSWIAVQQ